MSLICRKLTADDASQFKALRLEGAQLFPAAFLLSATEAEAADVAHLRDVLDAGSLWGLFDGDQMAGFAGLRQEHWSRAKHRAHVGPFYVSRSHQGRGAADLMLETLTAEAKRLGISQLELYVAVDNSRAIAFYARHGFVKEGRIPAAILLDGKPQDDFFFVRQL